MMAIPSKDSHRVGLLARRATAHVADVTGQTAAAGGSGHRSNQAIGGGATAASWGSLRRSRTASLVPSNIRASCRPWAALRFRRGTWPRWRHTFGPSAMPECHESSHDRTPTFQTPARWLRSGGYYRRQLRLLAFSEGLKVMIIKQLVALAVFSLALSGCATSLNSAAAGGATAVAVTGRHWCRDHRFYRYDLVWHLHHCGHW